MADKPSARDSNRDKANEETVEKQREIQREQDRKEPAEGSGGGEKGPPQTSALPPANFASYMAASASRYSAMASCPR